MPKKNLEASIAIYNKLQAYAPLEKAYQHLAYIAIKAGQVSEYEQAKQQTIRDNMASDRDKLHAHLGLAGLYKLLKNNAKEQAVSSSKLLASYESFYYSEAYKFTQGPLDDSAYVVLQRELGITENNNLGTYNIQQCVVIVAHSPQTKKVVLSHFDKFSGPLTFIKQLLEKFPAEARINIYLSGGRDRSPENRLTSDNNIEQVLKQLYFCKERFNIKATDLGDKVSPQAIVFDVKLQRLVHRTPNYPDMSLHSRVAYMAIQFLKANYLRPLNAVDFSKSITERTRSFTEVQLEAIRAIYASWVEVIGLQVPRIQPFPTEAWLHNQLIYPLGVVIQKFTDYTLSQLYLEDFLRDYSIDWNAFNTLDLSFLNQQQSLQDINFELFSVLHDAGNFPVNTIEDETTTGTGTQAHYVSLSQNEYRRTLACTGLHGKKKRSVGVFTDSTGNFYTEGILKSVSATNIHFISESLEVLAVAQRWRASLRLLTRWHENWIPILSSVKTVEGGNEQMYFINTITQEEQIFKLIGRKTLRFQARLHVFFERMKTCQVYLNLLFSIPNKHLR